MRKWLSDKKRFWPVDQLIHEFRTRNSENWHAIVEAGASDRTGDLFSDTLDLLVHADIRDHVQRSELYAPLLKEDGQRSISRYLQARFSESSLRALDRGSPSWTRKVEQLTVLIDAVVLAVIAGSVGQYASVGLDELEFLDTLRARSSVLLGPPPPGSLAAGALPGAARAEEALALLGRLEGLLSSATALAEAQRARLSAESEAAPKAGAGSGGLRGAAVLDDPAHDADYLGASVVPEPSELLDTSRILLPVNIAPGPRDAMISQLRGSAEADTDDSASADATVTCEAPVGVLGVSRFRDKNHYLNTHFQLLKADALTQLKIAITKFRAEVADAGGPSQPGALQKAALTAATARDEGRIDVYFDTRVQSVQSSRSGLGCKCSFSPATTRKIDWTVSKRFKTGSLLALSPDGSFDEDSLVFATVLQQPFDKFARDSGTRGGRGGRGGGRGGGKATSALVAAKSGSATSAVATEVASLPLVTISIDEASSLRFDLRRSYVMVESPVFFAAIGPVLAALQRAGATELPFAGAS